MPENYQVFARKYRPQTFDDVVGQEHITQTLKNAIRLNRLAHAYLFVGPRGIGKTSTARILAMALCCEKGPTENPCGVCDSCKEIAAGTSLDVQEIDGASNNGVEQVRELRENVRYAPTRGHFRIYIIDEVHMLTSQAFNALLKTLEEPPEHVKFIFATTEPQKVLATILSRCQRFDLRRIPTNLISGHLSKIAGLEKIHLDPAAAEAIAVGADGGLRDAESMLDQLVAFCGETIRAEDVRHIFGFTAPEIITRMTHHLLRGETSAALAMLDEQSAAGKDLNRLLSDLISHFRNLLVLKVNPKSLDTEISEATRGVLLQQAESVTTEKFLELIDQLGAAEQRMRWATNKKLQFEITLIRAIQTLSQASLDEVLEALNALREAGGAAPAAGAKVIAAAKRAIPAPLPPSATAESEPPKTTPVKRDVHTSEASKASAAPVLTPASTPEQMPALSTAKEMPISTATISSVTSAPTTTPTDSSAPAASDPNQMWARLIVEISAQRPLIKSWIQSGFPKSLDGKTLHVAFPNSARIAVESLAKANNRKLLEELLAKIAGKDISLQFDLLAEEELNQLRLSSGVPPIEIGKGEECPDPASSFGVSEPADLAGGRRGSRADTQLSGGGVAAADLAADFKNDPLVQQALDIFDGEIKSVGAGGGRPSEG